MEYIEGELELAKRASAGSIGQIALVLVFAYATRYYVTHPGEIAITGGGIVAFNLLRMAVSARQARFYPQSRRRWNALFSTGLLVPAACWGVLFLLVLIQNGLSNYSALVSVLIASGICAAVTTSVSPKQNLARTYITLVMAPALVHLIADMNRESSSLALIFLAYYWFLWTQLQIQHDIFWEGVRGRKRLTSERNRIEAVLDAVPGLIAWVGPDLKYRGVNRNYAKAFGADRDVFLGQTLGFLHPDPEYLEAVHSFVQTPLQHSAREVRICVDDTWRTHLLVMRKISHTQPEATETEIYLICIDTHDLKAAQSELEAQKVKSEMASKLAALGETTANIAHEIRNPLSAILISGELVRRELDRPSIRPEGLKNLAERIISTAKRIEKIIASLSKFSRRTETEPFTIVPLRQIVQDTIELVSEHFKGNQVALRTPEIEDRFLIRCRPVEISQVLMNLLNNGLDAAKSSKGERWVKLEVHSLDETVVIAVIDSGTGIVPQLREKIFEQFFTTKPPGRGTGLGLSVSQKIIERHGGKLSFDPSAKNTTFLITLPAIADRRNQKAA